jgi:hypothetical protein
MKIKLLAIASVRAIIALITLMTFSAAPAFAKDEPLKIPPGAYKIENVLFETKDDFCVTDETNRLLSAQAWKAHFEKLGAKCDITEATAPSPLELTWKGHCSSPALGKKIETDNKVRVVVMPAPNGFVISTDSDGDFQARVATMGKPIGTCRPGMPVYKPWG